MTETTDIRTDNHYFAIREFNEVGEFRAQTGSFPTAGDALTCVTENPADFWRFGGTVDIVEVTIMTTVVKKAAGQVLKPAGV